MEFKKHRRLKKIREMHVNAEKIASKIEKIFKENAKIYEKTES